MAPHAMRGQLGEIIDDARPHRHRNRFLLLERRFQFLHKRHFRMRLLIFFNVILKFFGVILKERSD